MTYKKTRRSFLRTGLSALALATPGCALFPRQSELRKYQPLARSLLQLTPEQKKGLDQAIQRGRKFKTSNYADSNYHDLNTGKHTELFRTPQETESALYVDCEDLAIWMANQLDQLQIPNQVVIGDFSSEYIPRHAWNELFLDTSYIADIAMDDITRRKGYIKKSDIPSTHYKGLLTFTGPYTEERLEKIQKEWSRKAKLLALKPKSIF